MEVHSHTHIADPDSHRGRKKWRHYFWEFLMLFLAVFCGFLAENVREHKVEKDRAKQYIRSLYEDLKADTANLNFIIKYDEEKIAELNTMTTCYDTLSKNWKETDCMGVLIKYSKANRSFQINDRTLRQLANAGGFRLLKRDDADSILGYESLYKGYQDFQATVFQEAQDNVRNTLNLLADFRVLSPKQNSVSLITNIDTSNTELHGPLLFSDDRVLLNKWFNELSLYLRVTHGQQNLLAVFKDKATGLIEFYKNKYHFE